MTKNSIAEILKKRWILTLAIFTVMGMLIATIFRLITPQEAAIEKTDLISTNKSGKSTNFNGINFTGSFASPVNALPVATMQPSQTTLDYVKNQLIEEYSLEQVVGINGLWRGPEFVLSYDEGGDSYSFYNSFFEEDEETIIKDQQTAIKNAQDFVKINFPNLNLIAQQSDIRYLNSLHEYEDAPKSEAKGLVIPFSYTIEGVPVYIGQESFPPITVSINSQKEVQKITFQTYFLNFIISDKKIKLIDLYDAIENINNNNEGSIISAYDEEVGQFSLDQITSGELTTAKLEYRADLETGLVYPFYRFSAQLINDNNQTIYAQIITPAVKTQ